MRGKKGRKWLAAALLLLCLAPLSACESRMTTFDAGTYVKGVLDETYKGVCDGEYRNLTDLTEADVKVAYEKRMQEEFDRFAYQFDLNAAALTDETKKAVIALLTDICGKAQYTIQPAVELDEKRYAVEAAVRPIDLFLQVREDSLSAYRDSFAEKYAAQDPGAMTEEARATFLSDYENDWAMGIVALCRDKMGSFNYRMTEHILVIVAPDEKGLYSIGDNDFSNLSALVLPY